jgi:hypothetical protein
VEITQIWQFVEIAIWAAGIGLVVSVYKDARFKKIILGIALVTLITLKVV